MKKFMLIVLVVIVMFSSVSTGVHAEDESVNRLLNDLFGYIYQCEVMCSDILWISDAFDRFDRERNWESLQLARAAVTIATGDIERCKLPELELTAEDRKNFMKRGIDINFLGNMKQMFEAEKTTHKNICMNLNNAIMNEVFLKDGWEISMRKSTNDRKNMNIELHYLANMADWVLASLNDSAVTKKFNDLMKKHCPNTHALQRKELESPEKIESAANAIMDQYEDILAEETKITGAAEESLNAMKYAIETGDFDLIRKNIMTISNMPAMIHRPSWFSNKDIRYYWRKDGKIQPNPKARTELERIPDICRVRVEGVSIAQVKAYQKELHDFGLPCKDSSESSGKLNLYYRAGGSEFYIIWDNGKAEILMTEKPFCLIPILYLRLMKQ